MGYVGTGPTKPPDTVMRFSINMVVSTKRANLLNIYSITFIAHMRHSFSLHLYIFFPGQADRHLLTCPKRGLLRHLLSESYSHFLQENRYSDQRLATHLREVAALTLRFSTRSATPPGIALVSSIVIREDEAIYGDTERSRHSRGLL